MWKSLSSCLFLIAVLLQVSIHGYQSSFSRNPFGVLRSPSIDSTKNKQTTATTTTTTALKLNTNNDNGEFRPKNKEEEEVKKAIEELAKGSYERKPGFGALGQLFTYKDLQRQARNESFSYVPIYRPGSYPRRALAALTYLIPIIDAADLGKYMFEAYPEIGSLYNAVFAPFIAIFNGVPFLPFAIFFAMAYVARGPQFPTEIRFHISQAFVLSLLQFIPSFVFPFMERASIPGMAVWYNTMFLFVILASLNMQTLLLLPFGSVKNPVILNTLGLTLSIMNRPASPFLKVVREAPKETDDKL